MKNIKFLINNNYLNFFTSKSCLKNLAVSILTPIAANTIAKLSS